MKRQVNLREEQARPEGKYAFSHPGEYLANRQLDQATWPEIFFDGTRLSQEEVNFTASEIEEREHIKGYDASDKVLELLGEPIRKETISGIGIEAFHYSEDVIVVLNKGRVNNLIFKRTGAVNESLPWTFAFVRRNAG